MLLLLACTSPDNAALRLGNVRAALVDSPVRGLWTSDFGKDPDADLGPLALVGTPDGVALLDQENSRVLRYDTDGALLGETPIPSRTTLDLAADGDGFALLAWDRLSTSWSAQRVDAAGTLVMEAQIGRAHV